MFEKEIKFISDFVTNKIKNLGTYFTYDELLNSDINPAILKFISAEIDYRIYEDRKKVLQQSAFDYSGSKISNYFNLIAKEIKKSTKVSFNDIKDVISQAIAFNADYTITPNEALKNLFFDKKPEKPVEDIMHMLNYIYYYSHIKEILCAYINKKRMSKLNSASLTAVLSEIDSELFDSDPEIVIEDAVETLSDFYNIGSIDKNKLSLSILEIYLREKNLNQFLTKLKKAALRESKQKYDLGEIKSILFSPEIIEEPEKDADTKKPEIEIKEESQLPKDTIQFKEPNVETAPETIKELDKKEIEFDISEHNNLEALYNFNEEEKSEEKINDKELKKFQDEKESIQHEKIKEELKNSEEFKALEEEKAPLGESIEEELLQDQFLKDDIKLPEDFELSEKESRTAIKKPEQREKDIFSYLSNKEIEKIVGYIFNDDRDDFASTMEKITETDSYEHATEILKSVFKSYNVNPYSKEAITLTNSVSNYFEQP